MRRKKLEGSGHVTCPNSMHEIELKAYEVHSGSFKFSSLNCWEKDCFRMHVCMYTHYKISFKKSRCPTMHYGNHVTFNQPQSFFKVVDISAQLGKLMPEMKKKNISRESNALVSRLIIDVIPFSKKPGDIH